MEIIEKEIRFYQTVDCRIPFQEWRDSLEDQRVRHLVNERLGRLRSGSLGDYKSIEQGVLELRLFFGPGYRIYVGYVSSNLILILSAGDKDSQRQDIRKALTYWADYRRRS